MTDPHDVHNPPPPASEAQPPEPPRASIARLFAVPLLIVLMIVAASVTVVLLFGFIAESGERSVTKLVDQIESSAQRTLAGRGDKVFRVAMLPEDKELWQAAKDLADLLQSDDPADLPADERPEVAERLGRILRESANAQQGDMGQKMQSFLLQALGQLGQPQSVDLLIEYALDESQPVGVRREGLAALVLMKEVPEARGAWPRVVGLLQSREEVLRIVAAVAIGALAEPRDEAAVRALADAARGDDREVMWNATLALARLGSARAAPGMLDMLDRDYWENIRMDIPSAPGRETRLTPQLIDEYLIVTMDAALSIGGGSLRRSVETLTEDRSLRVRDHAMRTLTRWPTPPTHPSAALTQPAGTAP